MARRTSGAEFGQIGHKRLRVTGCLECLEHQALETCYMGEVVARLAALAISPKKRKDAQHFSSVIG